MASVNHEGRKWISSSHGYRLWLKLPKDRGRQLLSAYGDMLEDEDGSKYDRISYWLREECAVPYKGELISIEQVRTTSKYMYFWITVSAVT